MSRSMSMIPSNGADMELPLILGKQLGTRLSLDYNNIHVDGLIKYFVFM